MRFVKSLLCAFSALAFATGAAIAGEESSMHEAMMEPEHSMAGMPEGEIVYIYPVEVTEYYLVIPQSQDLG